MSIRYRLAFYIFGFLISCFFVSKFLTAKAESRGVAFCYLPNCRVIKDIRSKSFKMSEQATAVLAQKNINITQIDEAIKNGEVIFSKSKEKINGARKYEIETQLPQNKKVTLVILNHTNYVILQEVKFI